MLRYATLYCSLIFISSLSFAQSEYEPLNYQLKSFNQYQHKNDTISKQSHPSSFHANTMSALYGEKGNYFRSYVPQNGRDSLFLIRKKYKERSWFMRKLMYENFIVIDTGEVYITIDPLLNVALGKENYVDEAPGGFRTGPVDLSTNTRGLLIRLNIGKKFAMETYAYENQAIYPTYIDDFVNKYEVVPGQGRVKTFYDNGFDFSQSGAYFSYASWENFNVQFGHHKHFIGDGYRSLILSDNSFNYPFLRYNISFWKKKMTYTVMYTSFQNLRRLPISSTSEAPFYRKGGSFHTLDYKVNSWLSLNLNQGMVWRTMEPNGHSSVNYNMFNPVIFSSLLFADGDDYNGLVGLGTKINPIRNLTMYGSAVYQVGGKGNDTPKLGAQVGGYYFILPTLRVQVEYNYFDSYFTVNNHYAQDLTNSQGNGFNEILFKADYRFRRWIVDLQVQMDWFVDNSYHQFIYNPDYIADASLVGRKAVNYSHIELAYLLNPATNLKIFANYSLRNEEKYEWNYGANSSNFYYLGVRTDLRNIYTDF